MRCNRPNNRITWLFMHVTSFDGVLHVYLVVPLSISRILVISTVGNQKSSHELAQSPQLWPIDQQLSNWQFDEAFSSKSFSYHVSNLACTWFAWRFRGHVWVNFWSIDRSLGHRFCWLFIQTINYLKNQHNFQSNNGSYLILHELCLYLVCCAISSLLWLFWC
jgi:hypothetical protein